MITDTTTLNYALRLVREHCLMATLPERVGASLEDAVRAVQLLVNSIEYECKEDKG